MEQARIDRYWLPMRLGGGKGGSSRKATKEHSEYIKDIKRELRKQQDQEKELLQGIKVQKNEHSVEPPTQKRQKLDPEKEVNGNVKAEQKPSYEIKNKGFLSKALGNNLADPKTKVAEVTNVKMKTSSEDLEEGEL